MTKELIQWISTEDEMPDADSTVLIVSDHMDPPVGGGYFDGMQWRTIEALPVRGVTYWAEWPVGPEPVRTVADVDALVDFT